MMAPTRAARLVVMTPGETLGLMLGPLAAALVCALPVLAAGNPVGAVGLAFLYYIVLGITPNFALGRRALTRMKGRRPLPLGSSIAGGALVKVATVLLLTIVGPPVYLLFDGESRFIARWGELAVVGAWALPVIAILGAVEGVVFWSAGRWKDRLPATDAVAGRARTIGR